MVSAFRGSTVAARHILCNYILCASRTTRHIGLYPNNHVVHCSNYITMDTEWDVKYSHVTQGMYSHNTDIYKHPKSRIGMVTHRGLSF